jgi:hypothetical protein
VTILRSIVRHLCEPFIIWTIIFSVLIKLAFISEIKDVVEWILESQIYLVVFTTSFVFLYFRQSYPMYKKINDIKKAQLHDKWVVARIMSDKSVFDMSLWLGGGVLFFADLMMSFGALYPKAIVDPTLYHQLELELPILGFVCIPIVSGYYTMRLDNHFKKLEIKLEKIDSEIMIPLLTTIFFITLSYIAIVNNLPH